MLAGRSRLEAKFAADEDLTENAGAEGTVQRFAASPETPIVRTKKQNRNNNRRLRKGATRAVVDNTEKEYSSGLAQSRCQSQVTSEPRVARPNRRLTLFSWK